ncbi:MAG: molybdopterin cofactor-binding domain-containing protein, partial [Pseudomonadota bacterium]
MTVTLTRRTFLSRTAAGTAALILPVQPHGALAATGAPEAGPPRPDAFIRIGTDDTVTIVSKFLDMGQGIGTAISTLIAEEMDADWATVTYVHAPADVTRYANAMLGIQGVGSSTSIRSSYEEMRRAGAAARARLVRAAAQEWD